MKLILIFLFSAITVFAQTPEWSRKYHTGSVTCLDFSGDGGKLLSGSTDSTIKVWNTFDPGEVRTLKSFKTPILSLDLNSSDSLLIVSVNYNLGPRAAIVDYYQDTILRVFNTKPILPAYPSQTKVITAPYSNISYFLTDTTILTGSGGSLGGSSGWLEYSGLNGNIFLQKIASGSITKNILTECGTILSLIISPNKKFWSESTEYNFREKGRQDDRWYGNFRTGLYDVDSNKHHILSYIVRDDAYQQFENQITKSIFTADSKKLLTQNKLGVIHIRSVPDGKIVDSLGQKILPALTLAADMRGSFYFSAHTDSTLRLWTPGIPNIFKRIQLESPVTTIAISPDSVHFATAHTDGTVALWNIDSLTLKAAIDSVFTPAITSITENQTICKGENAEFQVAAQSNFGEELLYQWQKGGVELAESDSVSGVQSMKLLLKNIDASDAGTYSVKVTSSTKPQAISASVSLAVKNIPVFKKPITALYRQLDWSYIEIILFHAELSDSVGAEYQWFKDGEEIPGATKSQYYFVRKDSALHAGEYSVRVTNQCGNIRSSAFKIETPVNAISEENPFKNTTLTAEPNPFKNSTTIRFSLEKPLKIKLAVTDILGREIAVLKDEVVEIGEQNVVFKNENLPDGTYFITLSGDGLLKIIPVQIVR